MKVRQLTVTALLIGLVALATLVIRIPLSATQGYVNVGDVMIFVSALLFGPKVGFLAGGLGSALADLQAGYAMWAPWTFVIKGLEGAIVGFLGSKAFRSRKVSLNVVLAMVAGASWMAVGYFFAAAYFYGWAVALIDTPANVIQGSVSIALAIPLLYALRRFKYDLS